MPNYPAVYAIRAGLDYICNTGVANIAAAADPLVEACLHGLSKLPVDLITPARKGNVAGIVAFRHTNAQQIHQHLLSKGIHVMHQAGRIRIALHGYNTMQDVELVMQELKVACGP